MYEYFENMQVFNSKIRWKANLDIEPIDKIFES